MAKIAFNWTLEVFLSLIAVGPVSVAFLLTANHYLKERNLPVLYLMISWFFLLLWTVGEALSYLLLSKFLFQIHIYFLIGLAFFLTILSDSISKEVIDPIKTSLIAALSALVLITSLEPTAVIDATFPNGDLSLAMAGSFRVVTTILVFLIGFLYTFYIGKIHWSAPQNLKFYSWLNLIGAILVGILPVLLIATGVTLVIPGLNLIFITSGALFCTVAFVSQPKLAYILPFRAIRLSAVEIEKGTPLYSYSWGKHEGLVEESYFSGMLSGLSHFAKEALGKGNIREIHLDDAILLIQRSLQYPVACVLFANKSSPSLRTALNFFAEQFFHDYSMYFLEEIQDLTTYASASNLITEFFPFVPEYE